MRETGDFGKFLEEHRDELTAIEALDAVPYNLRFSSRDMKALAKAPARRTSRPRGGRGEQQQEQSGMPVASVSIPRRRDMGNG